MRHWLQGHRQEIAVGLLLSLVWATALGAVLLRTRWPTPAPIVIQSLTPFSTPTGAPAATPRPIQVYVVGAVSQPGVYVVPWDSRVQEAIAAAGGATVGADLVRVNLAERLHDEQQVYVPYQGELATPVLATPAASAVDAGLPALPGKININTASAAELETLPGIGPALAQRVVEYRQSNGLFDRPEDIKNVKGIGEAIFAGIKDWITVE